MKNRIVSLLIIDIIALVISYVWVDCKGNLSACYDSMEICFLLIFGPLFVLLKYKVLFSMAVFRWPIPIFILLGYCIIYCSHRTFVRRVTESFSILRAAYIYFSWFIYVLSSLAVNYFAWYYYR